MLTIVTIRGGVEETRLEAKDTKKNLRPRTVLSRTDLSRLWTGMLKTKDTGASVLKKKT